MQLVCVVADGQLNRLDNPKCSYHSCVPTLWLVRRHHQLLRRHSMVGQIGIWHEKAPDEQSSSILVWRA